MKGSTLQIAILAVVIIMASVTAVLAGCHYVNAGHTPIVGRLLTVTGILGSVGYVIALIDPSRKR